MGNAKALLFTRIQSEGVAKMNLQALNSGIKVSAVPDNWTPDKRFIDYKQSPSAPLPDTSKQSLARDGATKKLLEEMAAALSTKK